MTDEPEVTEPFAVPEIFVDGYQSTLVANGVVRFTFFSLGHDPITNKASRRIVLRLNAPLTSVAGMQQAFGQLLEQVEEAAHPASGANVEAIRRAQ